MAHRNRLTLAPIQPVVLAKCTALGGSIALLVITFFLLQVDSPNPAWGQFWMIRPLVIVSLAGAVGGAFYYGLNQVRYRGTRLTILAIGLGLVVYLIGLWLGTILGLAGTMWH